VDKVKKRVRVRENNRFRSEQQGYSQSRFLEGYALNFRVVLLCQHHDQLLLSHPESGRSRVIDLLCLGLRTV